MPRFVILTHDWPHLHWDLMFEVDGKLRTWRLVEEPKFDCEIEAEQLPNHRLAYLDYEGPLTGDRGSVTCWDRGEILTLEYNSQRWVVKIQGERVVANVVICQRADSSVATVVFLGFENDAN